MYDIEGKVEGQLLNEVILRYKEVLARIEILMKSASNK
jgi:hypothetical protein